MMSKTKIGDFALYRNGRQIFFGKWDFHDLPGSVPAKLKSIRDLAMAGLAEIDALEEELREKGELSEKGIRAKLDELAGRLLADMAEAKKTTLNHIRVRLADETARLRGNLRRDPGDVAGQLADMERRTFLANLTGEQRTRMIGEMLEGKRPELAAAALRSEPELSGLSDTAFAHLQQKALEASNPEVYAGLQEDEAALQNVLQAIETTEREIKALGHAPQPAESLEETA